MQSAEIEVGRKYAMREKVTPGEPLIQVRVVDKVGRGGHIKVHRLSDPHSGLEEYVKTRQLVARWTERNVFLGDEKLGQKFAQEKPEKNQALVGAIDTVISATGYGDAWTKDDGTVHMEATEVREIARRAGLPQDLEKLHPVAYVDRSGCMHLPVQLAEELSRAFAAAEPQTVLMYIEDLENEFKARGYEPGERFWHDELRRSMPGFALARYWAGHEEEITLLRSELDRLRMLVRSAADTLQKAGKEREGSRLRRALDGR